MQPSPSIPIGFAHRGAKAHAPENTIEAFRLALELGATGLESDVWLTSDGVAVLDHDGKLRRGLRRASIRNLTKDELPSHIPSLEQLFDACGTDFQLSLDIQHEEAGEVVLDIANERDFTEKLWMCYWSWKPLAKWRMLNDEVKLVNSTRLLRLKEGPEHRAALLRREGIDVINMPYKDWNLGLRILFHRFEIKAFAWDAQQEREIQSLSEMGVDAIYSDYVDRLMKVLNRGA